MCSLKSNILYLVFFNILICVQNLVELPPVEDNNIAATEAVIRETVNTLFASLKFRHAKRKPRLKKYSRVHNFLVTIMLRESTSLKQIARLARVPNLDKDTKNIVSIINEILDEGTKKDEPIKNMTINRVQTFIKKLRDIKDSYSLQNKPTDTNIYAKIINLLDGPSVNVSNDIVKPGDVNDSDISDKEVWRPDNNDSRRIYMGHRTRVHSFPFMASIQLFDKFQCAASIIAKDLVITAASCIQIAYNNRFFRESPTFVTVQVGSDYYEGNGEILRVMEIYFHPNYHPATLDNNLVILRLSAHLIFRDAEKHIKRIDIDHKSTSLPANTDGITIIGWGAREASDTILDPWKNRLSFAEVDYYPLHECQEVYGKEYVTEKHFCAGYFSKGGGACNHDLGGPGISGGLLVGIISFGPAICGTRDAPTVFTKVGFYKDWIDNIIHMKTNDVLQMSTLRVPKHSFALHYSDVYTSTRGLKVRPWIGPAPQLVTVPNDTIPALRDHTSKEEVEEVTSSGDDETEAKSVEVTPGNYEYILRNGNNTVTKSQNTEAVTKNITVEDSISAEDNSSIDNKINDLLDELDILKLLESAENSSNVQKTIQLRAKPINAAEESYASQVESSDGISETEKISVEQVITKKLSKEVVSEKNNNDQVTSKPDRNEKSNSKRHSHEKSSSEENSSEEDSSEKYSSDNDSSETESSEDDDGLNIATD